MSPQVNSSSMIGRKSSASKIETTEGRLLPSQYSPSRLTPSGHDQPARSGSGDGDSYRA